MSRSSSRNLELTNEDRIYLLYVATEPEPTDLPVFVLTALAMLGLADIRDGRLCYTATGRRLADDIEIGLQAAA